ncbi:MAG: response regulator [Roseburia hominis]
MVQLLIVDDEPLVQIGIRSMLNWESMGIEIAGTATNGRQAYDIILEKHPEIVITDIKMPIMDGMQLIEKCQSQEHPPLFILLTSYEEFALVKQAISYQVLDYLVKLELTEDVLNAAIQKALGILEKRENRQPSRKPVPISPYCRIIFISGCF